MKLGADNSPKTWISIGLMVAALVLVVRGFSGSGPSAAAPAETATAAPTAATKTRRQSGPRRAAAPVLTKTLDPRLRLDLLQVAESASYDGAGRNIFREEAEPAPIPKVITPPLKSQPITPAPPPPPPPPPPIKLKFFGFASRPGEPKKIFLADGDEVFVAGEGEVVERRYKIRHIAPNSVEIEDVLNNNVQTITLSQV